MASVTYLVQDRAGTVHFDVPLYRPTSATVTIKTAGNADLPDTAVEDETATVDAFTRTVKTWSSATPRDIELNTGAGTPAVGRRYLTVTADGKRETAKIVAVDGDNIEIADKLPHDLAAADTVQSTRISYDLTADQLADRGLFRCRWDYVVGTETFTVESLFRTVKSLPYNPGTAAGLRDAEPLYTSRWDEMVQRDDSWETLIARAWDKVLNAIEGREIAPGEGLIIDRIVDWSQWEHVVYARVLLDMAPTRLPSQEWEVVDWVRDRRNNYTNAFNEVTNSIRWLDDSSGDRISGASETGANKTIIWMSR